MHNTRRRSAPARHLTILRMASFEESVAIIILKRLEERAHLNNFSAAGGNTGLLLEDAPESARISDNDPRTTFVVSATTKPAWSLEKNIQNIISYLD